MVGDKELAALRQIYYHLLVQLLWKEPEPEFVASLSEGLAERTEAAGQLHPRLGAGWRMIGEYLDKKSPAEVGDEFTRLFLGPYNVEVNPYESYYLAGGLFKEPLIEVRNFMAQTGMKKAGEDYAEPEDALAFELEIMNWLIQKQLDAKTNKAEQRWVEAQATFLKQHLLVWGPACARDIEGAESARFYKGAAALLVGLLEMDGAQFHGIGPEKVETLEEARKRHGGRRPWKGPTYDPNAISEPSGELES